MTTEDIIRKLEEDLAWRGPNGGKLGHIVLKREVAERVVALLIRSEADHG